MTEEQIDRLVNEIANKANLPKGSIDIKNICIDFAKICVNQAINYERSSQLLNDIFRVGEEVIYKGENYIIDFVDNENKHVNTIHTTKDWIGYQIPFKDLTKII